MWFDKKRVARLMPVIEIRKYFSAEYLPVEFSPGHNKIFFHTNAMSHDRQSKNTFRKSSVILLMEVSSM